MSIVDLTSDHLEWLNASVSGAEQPVKMYPLQVDLARGTRTVLVEYPDGWARPGAGTQPAGEELVVFTGAFTMSGQTARPGDLLLTTPRALRAATSSEGVTRAVAFFTGPGGGWNDGDADASGTVASMALTDDFERASTDGLVGTLRVLAELPEELPEDVEVIWLDAGRYGFIPRGGMAPEIEGRVLVRTLPRS